MNRFIENSPIKNKIIIIIMTTVVVSLLLVGTSIFLGARYLIKEHMVEDMSIVGRIIADRSTAALSFNDRQSASETLSALSQKQEVLLACIYDRSQTLFAEYLKDDSIDCPIKPQGQGYKIFSDQFEFYQSIVLEGESIGTVYLSADLSEFHNILVKFIILVIIIIIVAGFIAYLLAGSQQAVISRPILELAEIARKISIQADYSVQLPQNTNDEVGALNRAFKDMLEQIHKREILRDNAEHALRDNENNLTITLDSIGDGVIATDPKSRVTRMNPVAEKLTGWRLEEARGKLITSVFPVINAATREPMVNPIEKAMVTGEVVHLSDHAMLISKDGTEYMIADSAAPIIDVDKIVGVVLVFNEVSEQYKLRKAVEKSKRDFQAIMDHSLAVIFVKDIGGRYIFINRQYENLFHIKNEDICGKLDHDIFPASTADILVQNDKAVLAAKHALEFEEEVSSDDGLHTYMAIKFPMLNDEGEIYSICGIATDITERRLKEEQLRIAEERWQYALEGPRDGVWDWDLHTGKVFYSHRWKAMLGYEEDDIGETLDEREKRVHPDDIEQTMADLERHFSGETPLYVNEHRVMCKDGSYKWILDRGKVILWANDRKPLRMIGTHQDVTSRKQQEEQLRRSQKMDALGKLTGGIAHDYNNMLGVISGYAELLEGELGEQPELAEYTHEIRRAVKRGTKLTKKLLSFSRDQSSDAVMLNVNTLLQDEQNMLEKILTARVQLVLEIAEDIWPIWVDSSELEDCVINLCINAMHAIEGNGQLILRTCNDQLSPTDAQFLNVKAGDYVVLSVTDTGCGMDESIKERIFEPFYTTKGEKGSGLGLSQVYGFVNSNEGAIKVNSEPGKGTQFILYFPRHIEHGTEVELTNKQLITNLKGSETILVVDDEPGLLELTCRMLGQQGYHILQAENGEQAMEILQTESIDLLVSDVIMPGMDGYQLAANVKTQYPSVKIQLVSGYTDDRHTELVDDILLQQLIRKPYDSLTLLLRIRELLDKKHG